MSAFRTFEISDPSWESNGLRLVTLYSNHLRGRADCSFWTPENAPTPLPLVILLHGIYGSHWAWSLKGGAHEITRRLINDGAIPPMALAMPSDGLVSHGSGYLRQASGDFERWIVDDVPLAATEALPSVTADSPVFLAGLSMGGFGALRLGARHSLRFRGLSAHSAVTNLSQLQTFMDPGSLESNEIEDSALDRLLDRYRATLPPLRFDCGTSDFLIEANRTLHRHLVAAAVPHQYQEFSGGHNWPYWQANLPETLRFFGRILRGSETIASEV